MYLSISDVKIYVNWLFSSFNFSLLPVYVFLGDMHGLIDFSRLLKAVQRDMISEFVTIAMDERLYTEDPEAYLLKSKHN